MTFVQIIDCRTSRYEDMSRLMDDWVAATEGKRTATHALVGKDRAQDGHYVEIVEFPSHEDAMRNSNLPETDRIFAEMVALCDVRPSFTDLDVVRDDRLGGGGLGDEGLSDEGPNKTTARRFFEEVARDGDLGLMDELFATGYRHHDIGKEEPTVVGLEAMRSDVESWRDAFDLAFTLHSQLAGDDEVATRWTWRGTHQGDFMGHQPTGQEVTMEGTTTFRFQDGKIAEGWWIYDLRGLERQLESGPV
ncbi:ester cyclase [Streptomyces sp. VNUA116]|uniref:ester cyclase n=1 Tax=Streptomyces sp. VNUA116 TaxID=3062449 RepID=UPI0026771362|nr:ester cyclase [Streptomyces sp. VNUA116]WKU45387.1 ester cyclase [Streptomyces sp. VNUA116]